MTTTKTNNYIKLNNVRLSYPSLFHKKVWKNATKEPKYEATFILDKTLHGKEIQAINARIEEILAEHKINRSKVKSDHLCLRDGDFTDREEYQGSFFIKATNGRKFPMVNKDATTPLTSEDEILLYGGCYVSAQIDLRYYDSKAIGVAADLKSIQYRSPGEPFGSAPYDITGVYEPVEYTDDDGIF